MKIFDITRKLDVIHPQELFLKRLQVLKMFWKIKALDLHTESGEGLRTATASARKQEYPHSLKLSGYTAAMEVLEKDEIWVNRDFLKNYPMFMAWIRRNGALVMLICIREAKREQLSLYYLNLFKILCGLVETALLRALEYQEAEG